MLCSETMILPIVLGAVALALGVLSVWLVHVVHTRYRSVNEGNRETLSEFETRLKSSDTLHRSHTRRLAEIDSAIRLLEAYETQNSLVREASGGVWSTGTGVKVAIRDMTDLHLANCIAWIEELPPEDRRRKQHREGLKMLRAEARRRRYGVKLSRTIGVDLAVDFNDVVQSAPVLAIEEKVNWPDVDKLVLSLIERTGAASSLNRDLHTLRHLLARGRRS